MGDLLYHDYLPHDKLMGDGWQYPQSGDVFSFIVQKDLDGKNFINKLIEKEKALSEEKPSAERLAAEMKALSDEAKALVERWSEAERSLGLKRRSAEEIAKRKRSLNEFDMGEAQSANELEDCDFLAEDDVL